MSVLSSVFNRRKGIQKRLNNLTQIVRSHSPPSPASFASPDLNKSFDPYNLYAASQSSVNQALPLPPDVPPKRGSSPKVLLEFTPDNMSDWFPAELLQGQGKNSEALRRPERNVSLGVTHRRDASGGSQRGMFLNGMTMSRIEEADDRRKNSFASDDVIVIEAPRGRDPARSPLAASFTRDGQRAQPREDSVATTRRPLPAPLVIPKPPEARLHRAASLDQLPTALAESALSAGHSYPRSRHPSLTRSRSRYRSKSRPSSAYSAYSDTEIDNLSAVSGATLARALVASYYGMSPASAGVTSAPSSSTYSRGRGHLARQDSAILPRGELPFLYNRKSIRASKASLASGSHTPNTYWRDRRISGDHIVVVSPEDRDVWGGDRLVPPVPPMPEGLSPEPSARSRMVSPSGSHSRKPSPNATGSRRTSVALQSQPEAAVPVSDDGPDRKRRRVSNMVEQGYSDTIHAGVPNSASSGSSSSHYTTSQSESHDGTSITTAHGKVQSPDSAASTPALSSIATSPSGSSSSHAPVTPSSGGMGARSPIIRSFSDSSSAPRAFASGAASPLLPVGGRPRSSVAISPTQHTLSPHHGQSPRHYSMMSPLQPPQMPAASGIDSPESPDLLDMMFMGSRVPVQRSNGLTGTRVLSPPAPISVPPRPSPVDSNYEFEAWNQGSPSTSAVHQTFPETPYAFTPLVSAGFATPAMPGVPPPLPRTASTAIRSGRYQRSFVGKRALLRSATLVSPNPRSARTPITPPVLGSATLYDVSEGPATGESQIPQSAGVLSAIEEGSTPGTPLSMPSSYTNTPEHSPDLRRSMRSGSLELADGPSSSRPTSVVLPLKRALTRSPSPVPHEAAVPLPPSPMPSVYSTKSRDDAYATAMDSPSLTRSQSSPGPQKSQGSASPASVRFMDLQIASSKSMDSQKSVENISGKRLQRSRPPPPSGPRKPSNPIVAAAIMSRSRNGSVSSLAGPSTAPSLPAGWNLSASGPRFQTTPISFRGLTMEAAQWTLTSQQLQEVVSSAIKQSADASAIRLLPSEMLHEQVPEEIHRLETLSADLRTSYKVGVRKRKMLLGNLKVLSEGGELAEQVASARIVDEVAELSESLDRISEELYNVSDQLTQLKHLRDVHGSSALAMALRKLNSSFIKHLAEKENLRQQVAALEHQRDDAWRYAQEAAQELDDFTDKMSIMSDLPTPAASRRSSKVSFARKASLRKAGIRSPSRHAHRASVASRSSMGASPLTRHSMHFENMPPVPPIPTRTPLGILTSGLPTRSSGQGSATPTSEIRAMVQAQDELCQMLGINPDDLGGSLPQTRTKRSASISVMESPLLESRSNLARRNSDVVSPKSRTSPEWKYHYRSRSIDDRTAILATIGMSSP